MGSLVAISRIIPVVMKAKTIGMAKQMEKLIGDRRIPAQTIPTASLHRPASLKLLHSRTMAVTVETAEMQEILAIQAVPIRAITVESLFLAEMAVLEM